MTRQEAIAELKIYKAHAWGDFDEALRIAIEAIEKVDKLENWMEEQADDMR